MQTVSSLASVPMNLSDHPLIIEVQPGQRSQR
jgi:hypothetical protein